MRQSVIAAALVAAIVAFWGATIASPSKHLDVAPATTSIDVMQMMKTANALPEQTFDAY